MRTVVSLLLAFSALPACAGNARSERTAITFQRDHYRAQTRDAQWAQHFAIQRAQIAWYHDQPGDLRNPYALMQYRIRQNRERFLRQQPHPQPVPVPQTLWGRRY